jgi:hypothetical protein
MAHRDGDDTNGLLNGGTPWWVRAVAFVGVPSAIALFLVWWLVGMDAVAHASHQELLSSVKRQVDFNSTQLSAAHDERMRFWTEAAKQDEAILRTMQLICLHTARTDTERNECVRQ